MLPVNFPESNKTFTKPDGMTDEECSELCVYTTEHQSGLPVIISKWQPSKEDIEAINRGEGIWLFVYGHFLPPVSLQTDPPFTPFVADITE